MPLARAAPKVTHACLPGSGPAGLGFSRAAHRGSPDSSRAWLPGDARGTVRTWGPGGLPMPPTAGDADRISGGMGFRDPAPARMGPCPRSPVASSLWCPRRLLLLSRRLKAVTENAHGFVWSSQCARNWPLGAQGRRRQPRRFPLANTSQPCPAKL